MYDSKRAQINRLQWAVECNANQADKAFDQMLVRLARCWPAQKAMQQYNNAAIRHQVRHVEIRGRIEVLEAIALQELAKQSRMFLSRCWDRQLEK